MPRTRGRAAARAIRGLAGSAKNIHPPLDGLLEVLSRPASPGKLETETADDFVLTDTTAISGASIDGLLTGSGPVVGDVEVELYHVFPLDSDVTRTSGPPTFSTSRVPTRVNSPADVEIAAATRDGSLGTLSSTTSVLGTFTVANTVVHGIHPIPNQFTGGEGTATGEEVKITITFTTPIILPADHYFFRPEVYVTDGDFLWLSAPKPIVAPGTPFTPDLQAWIRNSSLAPDWLRIGTDITHQGPFNMTFALSGDTVPGAGTPREANCHGKTDSALAREFGGLDAAASGLGSSSVDALQDAVALLCAG